METGVMESNTEHTDCLFFFFSLLINESFVISNSWFSAGRQNDYPYQSFSQVVKCDCYRWCSSTYFQLCCKNEGVIFRKTDCCSSKERSETFTKTPAQINLLGFFFFTVYTFFTVLMPLFTNMISLSERETKTSPPISPPSNFQNQVLWPAVNANAVVLKNREVHMLCTDATEDTLNAVASGLNSLFAICFLSQPFLKRLLLKLQMAQKGFFIPVNKEFLN